MEIKVLGAESPQADELVEETTKAVALAGVEATVSRVVDLDDIAAHDVGPTPALIIDGEVKARGRVPRATQISEWLVQAAASE